MVCGFNIFLKYHTNNLLLCAYFLFCLQILNVCSKPKIEFFCHNNDYISKMDKWVDDTTTLYKITDSIDFSINGTGLIDRHCLTSYNGHFSIQLNSKTTTTGLVQQKPYKNSKSNINLLFNVLKNGSIQTNGVIEHITKYTRHKMFKLDGNSCDPDRNAAESLKDQKTEMYENCYSALDYQYENHDNSSKYNHFGGTHLRYFLSVSWVPDEKQTCLIITYIHKLKSTFDVSVDLIKVLNETNQSPIAIVKLEKSEVIKHLKIMDIDLMKDKKYQLSIVFKVKDNNYEPGFDEMIFGLIKIAVCSESQDKDVQLMAESNLINESKPFRIFGYGIERPAIHSSTIKTSTKLCLNGGLKIKNSKCVCPPGFKGEFCETGCGQNLYGSNCTDVCSFLKNKHCRGLLMCTNYGCTCPVGLTGPLCNEDCKSNKYGANCEQFCSSNCLENMCNKYTGICSKGCSKGFISPKCQEKYPYLIKPPTQILNQYESIQIQLNFKSNNINGGNRYIKMKYYQLLYKPLNEETFLKSEFKEIIENVSTVTETLNDLTPDTSYKVGVLILANDGNFNDADITYDTYKTSCKQPYTNDYTITTIKKETYTNITWNNIHTEKLDCKVQQYVLTLTLYQSEKEISSIQEIIPSSINSYIINHRYQYPGYNYTITMTPKTSKGYLNSMSKTIVNPSMMDVKIKDIVTTIKNSSIKVSWDLESLNSYNTSVEKPVIIKYKLKSILSCSLEDIKESEWTKKIINEKNYEIKDTVPNSQYSLQIRIFDDENDNIQQDNMVYLYTESTYPKTKPQLINNESIYVTNNSVNFELDDVSKNCKDLNGFFLNYYIELKDIKTGINQTMETKKTKICFDNLNQNTSYEMKVFIKTHFGFNPDTFLKFNFEINNLTSINDLMVYKTNIKNHMIGIRWKCTKENTILDVVLVTPNNEKLMHETINNATKCSAWPEYYCHTFNNKNISTTASEHYILKVRPIVAVYPHGEFVSISFDANVKEIPEPPKNLRTRDVKNDTVTLQWDIPWVLNSGLKKFIITAEEILSSDDVEIKEFEEKFTGETPTYSYTIMNLKPGSNYTFGVMSQAKTLLQSVPTSITITTNTNE
ncbi:Fibronectin type III,EGF-like, conserved site,Immunoglobulin-like fold [Cinara cedri]|uniref:Fibronectin type III,EGF-like, conserved site,Immunoglobulin-like fold n=1 Tax=Cinara cedri TaxID=506608 RepID=A0A5E4MAB9_9HEMI|nr:Fibronectin type III,EGF-like, conserved site,Immunoglobulin-like fold [Cinara cedri]